MSRRRAAKTITNPPGQSMRNAAPRTLSPAALRFLDLYTAITTTRAGNRRRIYIERGNEEKTQLKKFDRLEAVAIGRDLNRNNPKAITIINQRAVLTVGHVRAQFNTDDEAWNEKAGTVFNRYFARDCFHEYPAHLEEIAQLVEAAKMREGDILIAFDDFLLDSGKLLIWEADQLVTVESADWESADKNPEWRYTETLPTGEKISKPYFQDQGVICDENKRVIGYVVSSLNLADEKRACTALPMSDVLIIPAERARLVSHRFRIGQRRGVPSLLPVASNLADIDEMVKSELSTARMRSKIMAWVKHATDSGVPADQAAIVAELPARSEAAAAVENATGLPADEPGEPGEAADISDPAPVPATGDTVEMRTSYRKIAEEVGGSLEYLDDGDSIEIPNIDRPNLDTATFYNALGDSAGASQGLAKAYTRMEATSSYTAHRGETCMTDRHIRKYQKNHEHDWLDWLAAKVIRRAVEKGRIADGPPDWEYLISWDMPRPDAIDPEKEAKADALNMKNGKLTLRDLNGPGWRKRLHEMADQLKEARMLKIPLAIFETVAGAVAALAQKDNSKGDSDNER